LRSTNKEAEVVVVVVVVVAVVAVAGVVVVGVISNMAATMFTHYLFSGLERVDGSLDGISTT